MQLVIDISAEEISRLVFEDLLQTQEDFMDDLESSRPNVFSPNVAYDKAMILKHIDALELILDWYRDPSA